MNLTPMLLFLAVTILASVTCSVVTTAIFIKPIIDKVFNDLASMADLLDRHLDTLYRK